MNNMGGMAMLYSVINIAMIDMVTNVMFVSFVWVKVMKWATNGAVFTIQMPPHS